MADINLLVLNIGNSRLGVGIFARGELLKSMRAPHGNRGDWEGLIAEAWNQIDGKENAAIAGASVNPPLAEAVNSIVQRVTGRPVEWVGKEIELPIKVATERPGQTGTDRILNVAAAFEQMQKGCVVVDAGTAITIDVCDENGAFLGGAIAPGAGMMLAAMHDRTAQLPSVALQKPSGAIGKTTEEAMLQGVYHGIRGMVKELIENYATELGYWPELIATGGDAEKLFGEWELVHAISPDLTLYGVALAYANHYIKRGT